MKVAFTAEAERDLERIGDFISQDNPLRAASFVQEIVARCEAIVESPHGFPIVPRYAKHGIRRRVFGSYLIFYRVLGDRIDILHVLHGAQNSDAILG